MTEATKLNEKNENHLIGTKSMTLKLSGGENWLDGYDQSFVHGYDIVIVEF